MHPRGRVGHTPPPRRDAALNSNAAGFNSDFPNPNGGVQNSAHVVLAHPQMARMAANQQMSPTGAVPPYYPPHWQNLSRSQFSLPPIYANNNSGRETIVDPYLNYNSAMMGTGQSRSGQQINSRRNLTQRPGQWSSSPSYYRHSSPTMVSHNAMMMLQQRQSRPEFGGSAYNPVNLSRQGYSASQSSHSYFDAGSTERFYSPSAYYNSSFPNYPNMHPGYFTGSANPGYSTSMVYPGGSSAYQVPQVPYARSTPALQGQRTSTSQGENLTVPPKQYFTAPPTQPSSEPQKQIAAAATAAASTPNPVNRTLGFSGPPPTKQSSGAAPELVDLDEDESVVNEDKGQTGNADTIKDKENANCSSMHVAKDSDDNSSDSSNTDTNGKSYESFQEYLAKGLKRQVHEDPRDAEQRLPHHVYLFRFGENHYSSTTDSETEQEKESSFKKKLKSSNVLKCADIMIDPKEGFTFEHIQPTDALPVAEPHTDGTFGLSNNGSGDGAKNQVATVAVSADDNMEGEVTCAANAEKNVDESHRPAELWNPIFDDPMEQMQPEYLPVAGKGSKLLPTIGGMDMENVKIEKEDAYPALKEDLQYLTDDGSLSHGESPDADETMNEEFDQQYMLEMRRKNMFFDTDGPGPQFVTGLQRTYFEPNRLFDPNDAKLFIFGNPALAAIFQDLYDQLDIPAQGQLNRTDELKLLLEDYDPSSSKVNYMIYVVNCDSEESLDLDKFLTDVELLKPLIGPPNRVDIFLCKAQKADGPNIGNHAWRKISEKAGARFTTFFYDCPEAVRMQIDTCKNKYLRLAITSPLR